MLTHVERLRHDVAGLTPRSHKSAMGQFMTPARVAKFMASLFVPRDGEFRLLDAGAGLGALTCAVLDRWLSGEMGHGPMTAEVFELDNHLRPLLESTLASYTQQSGVVVCCKGDDYLAAAAADIGHGRSDFTHAILNPPYKKINARSDARAQARRIGLETVNFYSAFVGMALAQMREGGQLVAIIPRSFCNGPYYKPFRRFVLERAALHHIHLFGSRTQAFRDDEVLQENVILRLERCGQQGPVKITTSTDDRFADLTDETFPFEIIVKHGDDEAFIRIPSKGDEDPLDTSPHLQATLKDLGLGVSTGPIVDFRLREHLRPDPTPGSVPLLYPGHFDGARTSWPIDRFKKANAIARNSDTERWLLPSGVYTVVRRFSSKEEKRRVVASVVSPDALGFPERIGFENHLNVFHESKRGLPEDLAWGLFAYLNCTAVDVHFRRFNGHTQVNATDLKNIRYPSREVLAGLGQWAKNRAKLTQSDIDDHMEGLLR